MSNSAHIPPLAADGDAAAPAGMLEVVTGAIAEAELEAELEVGSGDNTEEAEVWFTNCISGMSLPFIGLTFAMLW